DEGEDGEGDGERDEPAAADRVAEFFPGYECDGVPWRAPSVAWTLRASVSMEASSTRKSRLWMPERTRASTTRALSAATQVRMTQSPERVMSLAEVVDLSTLTASGLLPLRRRKSRLPETPDSARALAGPWNAALP